MSTRSNTGCPVSGTCFCTGACRTDGTWVPGPPEPSIPDADDNFEFGTLDTSTLDLTTTYFWAFPQGDVESNSEALQFIMSRDVTLVEFFDGYAIVSGDFIPNLIDWGEHGFTIVAIDDSKQGVRNQIRDLS